MEQKIRIGVVINSLALPAWKVMLLKKIAGDKAVEIVAILMSAPGKKQPKGGIGLWSWHMQLDTNHFKSKQKAFKISPIDHHFENLQKIRLDNLQAIGACLLDVVICLDKTRIADEIYGLVKHGVMYFAHGPDGKSNERLLGYWEFIKMQEVITSSLVIKVSSDHPAKVIYQTWSMMPTMSMSRSRNKHMWKMTSFIPRALKEFCSIGSLAFFKKISKNKALAINPGETKSVTPSGFRSFINLVNHFNRMAYNAVRKLLYREQWILLIDRKPALSTAFKDFKKILPPKNSFWADPFLVENKGRLFLFFEELFYTTNKGHLAVMEILPDSFGPVQIVLEQPYHLSYPFVFQHEDKWYLIPESCEAKTIQLYECTDFPTGWKHKMNLMENICGMDTTLFYYENKWWLFSAIAETPGASHHDELCLFYADTPLTNKWTAHPKNPIITDVRTARPAGRLFWQDGQLIRPSQDCSKKYGYGFNLNIIEVMTETEYREKQWKHVRPDWDKKLKRTHSIASESGVTVIDGLIQRRKY
ncbi:MAG: hypothetical protein ACI8X3_001448 [Saprospiraceae bacterium]|jgi:hypothetical protein